MSGGFIVVLAILAFAAVTIFKGVRIVPQGYKWIVQRLGKYHTTLSPGLNFVIPYVDEVAYKVTTKDIVLDIPSQEVITRDNAVLLMMRGYTSWSIEYNNNEPIFSRSTRSSSKS
jgi:regulator of protease activity HflC (stomatin/prohibitin superfamily)